jgi:hypothetical protein
MERFEAREFYINKPSLKRQRVRARRRIQTQTNNQHKYSTPKADLFGWLTRPFWPSPFRKSPVGGAR